MTPAEAVVAAVWLIVEGEVAVLPIKGAGVDHYATNTIALATKPLGQGVNHDAGSMLNRTGEVGGGKGTVHNQGNSMIVGNFGNRIQVGHIKPWVAHGFTKQSFGFGRDRSGKILGIIRIHKVYLDPKLGQDVIKLGIGTTVEIVGGDDLISRFSDIYYGVKYSTGTGSDAQTGGSALEGSHPLLEHIGGWVHQAGVNIAQFAQAKEIGGMLGVVKNIGAGLVQRYGAGIGGGVWLVASMEAFSL